MAELHRRVVGCHGGDLVAPELAHIQHVGLVHAAKPPAPGHGQLERHLGDAVDLVVEVGHGVEGPHPALSLHPPLRGAEVNAAGKLTHHQQVNRFDHLPFEGGGVDQGWDDLHRPQVGEQAQR